MHIETEIEIRYTDTLGDTFPDDFTKEDIKALREEHIKDYCREHHIDRDCVKVIGGDNID